MCRRKKDNEQNEIPKVCCFCEYASLINDEEYVLCSHKGIVSHEYRCRKYVYDPLKRVPQKRLVITPLSEEDLVL